MSKLMPEKREKPDLPSAEKLLGKAFANKVRHYAEVHAAVKAGEEEKKELQAEMAAAMISKGMSAGDAVLAGDVKARLSKGATVTIDEKKLLQAGVAADVIERCKTRREYHYVLVTAPKEEADE